MKYKNVFTKMFEIYIKYFHLAEFFKTLVVPYGDNEPSEDEQSTPMIYFNLFQLAKFMDLVREWIKVPIIINSAYRTAKVNMIVGGKSNSLHRRGLAVDFTTGHKEYDELIISNMKSLYDYYFSKSSVKPPYYFYYDQKKHFIHLQINFTYFLNVYDYD